MKKIIFLLGGVRSGKSRYAVKLAKKFRKKVAFIATCVSPDVEMKRRIKLHQISRPKQWELIEEGKDIGSALTGLQNKYEIVLIDCLGLWISNLLAARLKNKEIERSIDKFIDTIYKVKFTTILVSNEVGSGIVPTNPLGRRFQDMLGLANQRIAKNANKVILMQAGIPITIKGGD